MTGMGPEGSSPASQGRSGREQASSRPKGSVPCQEQVSEHQQEAFPLHGWQRPPEELRVQSETVLPPRSRLGDPPAGNSEIILCG